MNTLTFITLALLVILTFFVVSWLVGQKVAKELRKSHEEYLREQRLEETRQRAKIHSSK